MINHQTDSHRQTVDSEVMTHVQDSLNVHGGDESFPLFVKLMETLLVPVTHTTHHNSKNNNDNG